jgi:putative DNA primase/helicase
MTLADFLAKLTHVERAKSGKYTAACPGHDDRSHDSLSVAEGKDGKIVVHCFAGCAAAHIVGALGLSMSDLFADSADGAGAREDGSHQSTAGSRRTYVDRVLADTTVDPGPVRRYLEARGLALAAVPPSLRFHPHLPYYDGKHRIGTYPAMVGIVADVAGRPIGLHRTYLDLETPRKAAVDQPKKALGKVKGGAIHLSVPTNGTLALAEGIETALAVHAATGTAVWSVLGAAMLGSVGLPDAVTHVEIWADHDRHGAGQAAAARAARAYHATGRSVRILVPPSPGDWLDMFITADGPEALRTAQATAAPWEPPAGAGDSVLTALLAAGVRFDEKPQPGGPPITCLNHSTANLTLFLETHPDFAGRLGLNLMSQEIVVRPPGFAATLRDFPTLGEPFTYHAFEFRQHFTALADYFEREPWQTKGLAIGPRSALYDAVHTVAERHVFHPLVEYIESRPAWDGVNRLAHVAKNVLGTDCPIAGRMLDLFIRQAVARVLCPGTKADLVAILVGQQGIGKNRLVTAMNADFASKQIDSFEKPDELVRQCQNGWFVELSEMAVMTRSDLARIKAIITRTEDHLRRLYAEQIHRLPRHFCFIGTTNETSFLSDTTGNRRFLCLQCPGETNTPATHIRVDRFVAQRDQLYAEARDRCRAGERWWPDDADIAAFAGIAREHQVDDSWSDLLRLSLYNSAGQPCRATVTTLECFTWLGLLPKDQHPASARRLAGIMHRDFAADYAPDKHLGRVTPATAARSGTHAQSGLRGYRYIGSAPLGAPDRDPKFGSNDHDDRDHYWQR